MIKLYQINLLTITEITGHHVYAQGAGYDSIAVCDAPDEVNIGDDVWAFVYLDADDEAVATMAEAYAHIGECAYLEVVASGGNGTYLDWGLPKDLILPFSEQLGKIRKGHFCFVYIYQDENERPIASMKIHKHLNEDHGDLEVNEEVDLIIASETDIGYTAVINNEYLGLIYNDELSCPLNIGTKMKGWVKKIRDDGKIDLNINKLDDETRDELEEKILADLKENNSRLNLSDKSAPDLIYARFSVSKKNFKRALGNLYKKRLINIHPEFIELVNEY